MTAHQQQQAAYLQRIQERIAPKSLVKEMMSLFNCGQSSAYRRMSGTSLLTFEEMTQLIQRFNVSYESQLKPLTMRFKIPFLYQYPRSFTEYLDAVEQDLTVLSQTPEALIQYVAHEMPFFHYLFEPDLSAFKLYMWGRYVWNIKDLEFQNFDLSYYQSHQNFQNQTKRLSQMYAQIKTEEIWNSDMLDTTLNQIRHCYRAGRINIEQTISLLATLRRAMIRLNKMVEQGSKLLENTWSKGSSNLQVWYNELFPTSTFVTSTVALRKALYLTFDSPNFIQTIDENIFNLSDTVMDRYKESALFLINSELNQNLFFARINKKIDISEEELNAFTRT